jgi:hypothetical protein
MKNENDAVLNGDGDLLNLRLTGWYTLNNGVNITNCCMDKEKTAYYRDRLVSCDQKDLFSVVDKMINGSKRPTLPL